MRSWYTKIRNWCIRAMTTVRTRPMPTTRDRILDAAERLLARFGYKKTTMEDIAREAGLGKRTLYLDSLLPYSLTARELGKREDVKQKALRIADLLLAGLRPRRTAPNPREKSS